MYGNIKLIIKKITMNIKEQMSEDDRHEYSHCENRIKNPSIAWIIKDIHRKTMERLEGKYRIISAGWIDFIINNKEDEEI
jgi:hypothetical protein